MIRNESNAYTKDNLGRGGVGNEAFLSELKS